MSSEEGSKAGKDFSQPSSASEKQDLISQPDSLGGMLDNIEAIGNVVFKALDAAYADNWVEGTIQAPLRAFLVDHMKCSEDELAVFESNSWHIYQHCT